VDPSGMYNVATHINVPFSESTVYNWIEKEILPYDRSGIIQGYLGKKEILGEYNVWIKINPFELISLDKHANGILLRNSNTIYIKNTFTELNPFDIGCFAHEMKHLDQKIHGTLTWLSEYEQGILGKILRYEDYPLDKVSDTILGNLQHNILDNIKAQEFAIDVLTERGLENPDDALNAWALYAHNDIILKSYNDALKKVEKEMGDRGILSKYQLPLPPIRKSEITINERFPNIDRYLPPDRED